MVFFYSLSREGINVKKTTLSIKNNLLPVSNITVTKLLLHKDENVTANRHLLPLCSSNYVYSAHYMHIICKYADQPQQRERTSRKKWISNNELVVLVFDSLFYCDLLLRIFHFLCGCSSISTNRRNICL